jgi:hypothetical protein
MMPPAPYEESINHLKNKKWLLFAEMATQQKFLTGDMLIEMNK